MKNEMHVKRKYLMSHLTIAETGASMVWVMESGKHKACHNYLYIGFSNTYLAASRLIPKDMQILWSLTHTLVIMGLGNGRGLCFFFFATQICHARRRVDGFQLR